MNCERSLPEAPLRCNGIQNMIDKLDINTISPVEALLKLNEIKSKLTKD